ncbi:MAG: hypothetical protein IT443_11650 [Phycisphaeraceae bacterium]|nr:hypothetical protein [Phycisphaeraceae bacterium]
MSLRAVIVGLLLGLAVSSVTYFNDSVIRQTMLIGNLFPVSVFGVVVVLLLVFNPLLGAARFRAGEVAIVTALGLAACGWPGSGFFRTFTGTVALPAQLIRDQASWQGSKVMSYLPGGSADLGAGHVRDWEGLAHKLAAGQDQPPTEPLGLIWQRLPADVQGSIQNLAPAGQMDPYEQDRLLTGLNSLIQDPSFGQEAALQTLRQTLDFSALEKNRQLLSQQAQQLKSLIAQLTQERDSTRQAAAATRAEADNHRQQIDKTRQDFEQHIQQLGVEREALLTEVEQVKAEQFSLQRNLDLAKQASPQSADVTQLNQQAADLEQKLAALTAQISQNDQALTKTQDSLAQTRRDLENTGTQLARIDHPSNRLTDLIKLRELDLEHTQQQLLKQENLANRQLLVAMFPAHLSPAPPGQGWLVNGGEADPMAIGMLGQGWDGNLPLRPTDLPWAIWWPTLRLWGGVALLLGLASLFMVLIVHPQWSHRELLPYPIARFIEEITETQADRRLPAVCYSKLFWLVAAAVLTIHCINGIQVYYKDFIAIPVEFNFYSLATLAPQASRAPMSWAVYFPHVYFSVIGFAFFLRTEMSLSLGLVGIAYMLLASVVYSYGVPLSDDWFTPGNFSLLLFGAWLGGAIIILYTGRRYYLSVAAGALGLGRSSDVPDYAVWAGRGLVLCIFAAVWLLTSAGLDWVISSLLVLLLMVMFLVLTRINAETGAFFIQPSWIPLGVLVAVLGDAAVGPTAYLLSALGCIVLAGDPRETVAPFLANGLQMADRAGQPPRKVASWLGLMVVLGFVTTLLVTLMFQYNQGVNLNDAWATKDLPSKSMANTSKLIIELGARNELSSATDLSGLDRLAQLRVQPGALPWIIPGVVLVIACALARLRLAWWPIHPVIFMVFGTMPAMRFAASFLLGWAIKAAVVKLGGTRTYHQIRPLMIGLIAGEIVSALVWTIVGAIYYWVQGTAPVPYGIFPG